MGMLLDVMARRDRQVWNTDIVGNVRRLYVEETL